MFTISVNVWFASMFWCCAILWFLSRNDEDHNTVTYYTVMSWVIATATLFVESLGR